MYRDDDVARGDRANALISEIGELERKKVEAAAAEQRLAAARDELATLQATATVATPPVPEKHPSFATHFLVFSATAGAAYAAYVLLLAG